MKNVETNKNSTTLSTFRFCLKTLRSMKKSHIEQAKKSSPYKQKNCQFIKSHLKKKMRLKMKERKHEIHSHRRSFNQNDILDQLVKEEWVEMVKENPGFVDEVLTKFNEILF